MAPMQPILYLYSDLIECRFRVDKRPLTSKSGRPLFEKLKVCRPAPSGTRNLPRRALGLGPNRRPRRPDSQFLEPFRPRHPRPPWPAQPAPLRADLEHVARGAEFRVFGFSDFRGRESEIPIRHTEPYSGQPTSRSPELSFRFRHLVMGRRRFGLDSGSGPFRMD